MGANEKVNDAVLNFWNDRAKLKNYAGTNDLIAKQIEINAISNFISEGMNILEVGCGNGLTAIDLASRYNISILGIDFAEEMISAAKEMATQKKLRGSVNFEVGDVRKLPGFDHKFDLIYTERVLINLSDWAAQKKAIGHIAALLKKGGLYVMCENSLDGLDKINKLREKIGLPLIKPPWHNRYFIDSEIEDLKIQDLELENVNYFSSTYYFLSRIVNAYLAHQENKEPDYESPINCLSLKLPAIGDLGQGRIWLWRKK